ncbi:AEC family transporter [Marinomonas sp. 15G1-11]|uniref:AEC family transporter n=1 Tax=Marinomonas phaeophyticola TaxID=3004091 RepID=A0ABT4JSY0_9GAMM|nr:AEC family transporter [Marinomonas sp. 15G1-11]MCZ2721445.1 AEC family transporter [Marinomonas sp. 15G1-11]
MLDILLKIMPLFALVAIGYFCKSKTIINAQGLKYLTHFVMYLSLPAVLLGKLSTTDFATLIDIPFLIAYLLSLASVILIAGAIGYLVFEKNKKNSIMLGLGGVYGNIGFLAIPVLTTTVGEWVSVPLALMLTLDLLILLPLATFLLQLTNTSENSQSTPLKALKRSLLNPLILSIALGLLLSVLEVQLPNDLLSGLGWLGSAAGPCAMFIVGTALFGRKVSQKPMAALYISAIKLLIMPFVVFVFMSMLNVDSTWVVAATLGASMPCAAVLGVIAEEHKAIPHQASTAVLLTTIFSVISIPVLINLFN